VIAWTREQNATEVAWCGHAPDVDEMTAALIGGPRAQVVFSKGAVAAIEFDGDVKLGDGQLKWLVTPKLMGK
jgi:phosphohistidine phosphatase SixA